MRWIKFNVVGAMGLGVQFGLLAVLVHVMGTGHLWAAAISVELSIIHNFLWHRHWTWKDRDPGRRESTPFCSTLWRFHVANGGVSLVSALAGTAIMGRLWHLDPMISNAVALIPGAIVNYLLSDRMVFVAKARPLVRLASAAALVLVCSRSATAAQVHGKTLKAWELYEAGTEARIERELKGASGFLNTDFMASKDAARIRTQIAKGGIAVQKMQTVDSAGKGIPVPDGMIHHWYGAVFIPNVGLDRVLARVQDYNHHDRYFKEVVQSKLVSREGDRFHVFLRLKRTQVVTVEYNTEHTAEYRSRGKGRASSLSRSTRIAQVEGAGSKAEKERPIGDDSGYLWRLNSYWRFKEQDGGVVVECESVSLSRAIPAGFGWLVGPFVESVPEESLEKTLNALRDGILDRRSAANSGLRIDAAHEGAL